jgi:D-glycero-D-manno-heptose 1,7-bisphosphate phosphatase
MNYFKNYDLVILVGGRGSRLKSIISEPKPLIKIANIHFVQYLINYYSKYNFKKIYLITSYKSKIFSKKFNNSITNLIETLCIKENSPLDTAGALNTIRDKISKNFVLINGDSFLNYDISKINPKNKNLLLLIKNKNYFSNSKLSSLEINSKYQVQYSSKKRFMNAGIYFFNRRILKKIPRNKKFSLENDLIPEMMREKSIYGKKVNGFFIDIGTPRNLKFSKKLIPKYFKKRAAILDRDGVINYDYGYVHKWKDFKLKSGIIKSLRELTKKNFYIFIITNQSGIARGYYSEENFIKFHQKIKEFFFKKKIIISDIFYCPHHISSNIKRYKKDCKCRKPGTKLFSLLKKKWPIITNQVFMLGDKKLDYLFAKKNNIYFEYPRNNQFKQIKNIINNKI